MKKYINIASVACLAVMSMATIGCSSDLDGANSAEVGNTGSKVVFQPSVGTRAASDGKTDWVKGNKIFVVIDGNATNACYFTYSEATGLADWTLSKFTKDVSGTKIDTAFAASGTFTAVYADSIVGVYDAGTKLDDVATYYDVLYGVDGTYTKTLTTHPNDENTHSNVIIMNVNMNKRPLAKIRVNGVPAGFARIKGLREYISCDMTKAEPTFKDAAAGNWGAATRNSEGNNNYTFYGTLSADSGVVSNGSTTISLISNDGKSVASRTYNKTVTPGEYVIMKGPKDSIEGGQWACSINSDTIVALVDTTFSMTAFTDFRSVAKYNEGASYSSDKTAPATVSAQGVVTTGSTDGSQTVKATANGADMKNNITLYVKYLEDVLADKAKWAHRYITSGDILFSLYNSTANCTTPIPVTLVKVKVKYPDGTFGPDFDINQTIEAGATYQGSYGNWESSHPISELSTSSLVFEVKARNGKTYTIESPSLFK